MDINTQAQKLFEGLAELYNMGSRIDARAGLKLQFGDAGAGAVELEIDEPARSLQMYSVLGPVPAWNRQAVYRHLLEANFAGHETEDAVLSVDGREDVILCRRLALDATTPMSLAENLQAFSGLMDRWRPRLLSMPPTTSTDGPLHQYPAPGSAL
jgi:hypothetical protein